MSISELLRSKGFDEESMSHVDFYKTLTIKIWPDELTSQYLALRYLKESYSLYATLQITPSEFQCLLESILGKYPTWKSFVQCSESIPILLKGYGPGIAHAYHNRT